MQKVLVLLVGIFIGNTLINFGGGSNDIDATKQIKSAISGQFGDQNSKDSVKATEILDSQKLNQIVKEKAKAGPKVNSLKASDSDDPSVDSEISKYFGESDLEDSDNDVSLGDAYRAEIRQESRRFQKKLIQQ